MQKRLFWSMFLIWILVACASPVQTGKPAAPNDNLNSTNTPAELTPAERAAVADLSRMLDLPTDNITLVSTESVIWPDDCLGVPRAGVVCNPASVEGFGIVLSANDKQYDYHTNLDGSALVLAQAEPAASRVAELVIDQLTASLGLNRAEVAVISSSDAQFADSCMGVPMLDVKCAQVAVSGKILILEARGVQYEYHVRSNGLVIQPATLAVLWTRDGGAAGFCDAMLVFLSGEVYGTRCNQDPDRKIGTFAELLSSDDAEQLDRWIGALGRVDLDASDPEGVSDRLEVILQFYGTGAGMLDKSEEQALLLWTENLFRKLFS